ncbi:MAG: DNA-processing protein DprA, partial [Rhodothermales bacterium]|nr:DNA-processing protein DprA [Rhodothermales bacterium]
MSAASTDLALALLRLDGVGRVTAGRLLRHFPAYETLRACPREQVLLRLKGTPNAEALVAQLFDEAAMRPHLDQAEATRTALAQRQVTALTSHHDHWPAGLDDLARADRPVVLYAFGTPAALTGPVVSLFARPPLEGAAFETAQALVRRLVAAGLTVATGAQHGFDVVVAKLAAAANAPAVLVAHAGLARLPKPLRPHASAAAKAGGVLLSPFAMAHGPFDHDDRERALVQAALARACVFVAPPDGSPEARALAWAVDAGRPVFGIAGEAPL